jgi:glycosyltransferase involved in cell wall biosynthesis
MNTRVHVASANTRPATELCIRSLRRFAGQPFDLVVGDVGSTDGSLEMLRGAEQHGWLRLEVAESGWRLHFQWIDEWLRTCPARYAVFVDSDLEIRRPGWLSDLVGMAETTGAALVCAEFEGEVANYVHPSGRAMRIAARPAAHLLLIDTEQVRDLDASFEPRFEDGADVAEGGRNYDLGALYFDALVERGLRWVEMPLDYRAKYRHYGGLSWSRDAPGRERWERRKKLTKIRIRLLMYRTLQR